MNQWILVTSPVNYEPCVDHQEWATMDAARLDPVQVGDGFLLYVKSGPGLTRSLSQRGTHTSNGLLIGAFGTVVGRRHAEATPYWDRYYPAILELEIEAVPERLVDLRMFLGEGATSFGLSLQGQYLRQISASQYAQWSAAVASQM